MSAPSSSQGWLLAIDTSTEQAGIALTDGTRTAELSWWAERDQTVTVLAQIDRLIDLIGITPADVAAIAVANGPGMFNGLRVGMSVAKGWHLGSGAALIGISTFDITTEPFRGLGLPVIAAIAAGRGRIVWQLDGPGSAPVNGTVFELAEAALDVKTGVLVAGDLTEQQVEVLTDVSGVVVPAVSARSRRPGVLAELGWRRFVAGDADDPVALAPVYVHAATAPARE